jgi:hypothetical protein
MAVRRRGSGLCQDTSTAAAGPRSRARRHHSAPSLSPARARSTAGTALRSGSFCLRGRHQSRHHYPVRWCATGQRPPALRSGPPQPHRGSCGRKLRGRAGRHRHLDQVSHHQAHNDEAAQVGNEPIGRHAGGSQELLRLPHPDRTGAPAGRGRLYPSQPGQQPRE